MEDKIMVYFKEQEEVKMARNFREYVHRYNMKHQNKKTLSHFIRVAIGQYLDREYLKLIKK